MKKQNLQLTKLFRLYKNTTICVHSPFVSCTIYQVPLCEVNFDGDYINTVDNSKRLRVRKQKKARSIVNKRLFLFCSARHDYPDYGKSGCHIGT